MYATVHRNNVIFIKKLCNNIMIKKLKTNILYFLICLTTFSCSSQNSVKDNLEKMKDSPICITENNMKKWVPKNYNSTNKVDTKKFSFIVYADSSQCSPCFINGLKEWNKLLGLEKSQKYNIQFIFIIEPRIGEYYRIRHILNNSHFDHVVLIDKQNLFRKENPQIPNERMYHTFLLDPNNNVVLVGNPLFNPKLEKMLRRILQEKLKK